MGNLFSSAGEKAGAKAAQTTKEGITEGADKLSAVGSKVGDDAKVSAERVGKGITGGATELRGGLETSTTNIKEGVEHAAEEVKGGAEEIKEGATTAAQQGANAVHDIQQVAADITYQAVLVANSARACLTDIALLGYLSLCVYLLHQTVSTSHIRWLAMTWLLPATVIGVLFLWSNVIALKNDRERIAKLVSDQQARREAQQEHHARLVKTAASKEKPPTTVPQPEAGQLSTEAGQPSTESGQQSTEAGQPSSEEEGKNAPVE